jgi:predicted PurR-regulated permease PerM
MSGVSQLTKSENVSISAKGNPKGRFEESEDLTQSNADQRLGAILFYGFVAGLAYLVFRVISPFLAPLVWAGVLAVVFYPWHQRLEKRWGKIGAAAASTTAVTFILVMPMILVSGAFVRQGLEIAHALQQDLANGRFDWANQMWTSLQNRFDAEYSSDLNSIIRDHAEEFARYLAAELGVVLQHVVRFGFDLVVMILAMFYLFRDGEDVMRRIRNVLPFEAEHRERMISEAHDLIFASVLSSLITAAMHGIVGGVMFAILGIQAPLFWGVMMALFSILPVVGSSLIWVPAAIWLFAQGYTTRGIVLVAVCAGVVAVVENVLRPWLISGRAHLSALVIFISVLGGISVFGILGVILGPIVVATAASVLDIYTHPEPKRHAAPRTS